MSQWHVPFDHIEETWTDRQFHMFTDRLLDRIDSQSKAQKKGMTSGKKKLSLSDIMQEG